MDELEAALRRIGWLRMKRDRSALRREVITPPPKVGKTSFKTWTFVLCLGVTVSAIVDHVLKIVL